MSAYVRVKYSSALFTHRDILFQQHRNNIFYSISGASMTLLSRLIPFPTHMQLYVSNGYSQIKAWRHTNNSNSLDPTHMQIYAFQPFDDPVTRPHYGICVVVLAGRPTTQQHLSTKTNQNVKYTTIKKNSPGVTWQNKQGIKQPFRKMEFAYRYRMIK